MLDKIGIDIDTKDKQVLETVLEKSREYGNITVKETKHGYHILISLDKEITYNQSFWIRFIIGDDRNRLLFDLLRFINGNKRIDVLWDKKIRRKIIVD